MDNPVKQLCGVCHDEWLTEVEYLNHVCPGTNYTPQQAEHLINSTTPDFAEISVAAIQRGNEQVAPVEQPVPQVVPGQELPPQAPTISLG